jgi:hypothetical protein
MKICGNCKQNKALSKYSKRAISKDGLQSQCKECCKTKNRDWNRRNPDKIQKIVSKWVAKNPEKVKEMNKDWREDNLNKCAAYTATYKAVKKHATLDLQEDQNFLIGEFYKESTRLTKETGIPHEVDHIIPLQGEIVSGLHVPWNLRVVTKEVNRKKSNKLIENL